jgi:hypothetical protein
MDTKRIFVSLVAAALLALGGCATSPEDESRRIEMEADIDEILSYELDKTEFGDPLSCLSENSYRSSRPLGNRHILFEGRNNKQWINVLRGRCASMSVDSLFVINQYSAGRACDKDRFEVRDRFGSLGSSMPGPTCVLGEFIPVAKAQVEEIETRLEMR